MTRRRSYLFRGINGRLFLRTPHGMVEVDPSDFPEAPTTHSVCVPVRDLQAERKAAIRAVSRLNRGDLNAHLTED